VPWRRSFPPKIERASPLPQVPTIAALEIKGSRALARPVQEHRKQKLHNAIVEIDVSVAGHSSTYIFNCIIDTGMVVVLLLRAFRRL